MQKKKIKIGDNELDVMVAKTVTEKRIGVSLLDKLEEREGMIFQFKIPMKYGFWMRGVRFPIDIIWIRNEKVVGINHNVPAGRGMSLLSLHAYYPPVIVNCVIELAGGEVERLGIKTGDGLS